jgi:hypothetical protein
MMTRNKGEKTEGLAAEVRRQFGAEATKRFLRNLPAFRTEADIPDRLRELLDRLDGSKDGETGWRRQ